MCVGWWWGGWGGGIDEAAVLRCGWWGVHAAGTCIMCPRAPCAAAVCAAQRCPVECASGGGAERGPQPRPARPGPRPAGGLCGRPQDGDVAGLRRRAGPSVFDSGCCWGSSPPGQQHCNAGAPAGEWPLVVCTAQSAEVAAACLQAPPGATSHTTAWACKKCTGRLFALQLLVQISARRTFHPGRPAGPSLPPPMKLAQGVGSAHVVRMSAACLWSSQSV